MNAVLVKLRGLDMIFTYQYYGISTQCGQVANQVYSENDRWRAYLMQRFRYTHIYHDFYMSSVYMFDEWHFAGTWLLLLTDS